MNRLRTEIEPDFETAQQHYPLVLKLIANCLGSIDNSSMFATTCVF